MALQQNRIVRFFMIICAVVLTIFIYASYYSNSTITIPTRIHHTAALISTVNSNTHDSGNSFNITNFNQVEEGQQRGKNGGNDHSSFNNNSKFVLINVNKNNNNNNSHYNINHYQKAIINEENGYNKKNDLDSDNGLKFTHYPGSASNIENLINNADKILRNLTVSSIVNENLTVTQQHLQEQQPKQQDQQRQQELIEHELSQEKKQEQKDRKEQQDKDKHKEQEQNKTKNNEDTIIPQPPSSTVIRISPQQQIKSINTTNLTSQQLDLLNGMPTGQFYESGHLDINPNLCPSEGDQIRLLIVITSAPTDRDARLAIRQTWGHYGVRRDVAIGFILGRSLNTLIEESLDNENYIYGDLIRGRFIDSYYNLTLKTISILEWVEKECPLVSYVLKTDDDMFINVPKLLSFIDNQLSNQKDNNNRRIIYGRLAKKWKPIRNTKSKYYVSPGQYSQTVFPQFTTGPAYLMSSDIIHDLYINSLKQKYLKLEDVFTTGIVAQLLNIKRIHVNEFLNRRIAFNPCNIRKAISIHMIKANEQFDLWKKLLDNSTKCK